MQNVIECTEHMHCKANTRRRPIWSRNSSIHRWGFQQERPFDTFAISKANVRHSTKYAKAENTWAISSAFITSVFFRVWPSLGKHERRSAMKKHDLTNWWQERLRWKRQYLLELHKRRAHYNIQARSTTNLAIHQEELARKIHYNEWLRRSEGNSSCDTQ